MELALYEKKRCLGKGTFGEVFEAMYNSDGKNYAIKANLGFAEIDGLISLEDLNFAKQITGHPSFLDIIRAHHRRPFQRPLILPPKKPNIRLRYDDLYFVMDIADSTLEDFQNPERYRELLPYVRRLFCQILLGLEFMHVKRYTHRDIKSNNILIFYDENNVPSAKISDYGFARSLSLEKNSTGIQNYIYRAPEIASSCINYTNSVDIWSAGIILFQMITMKESPYSNINGRDKDRDVLERIHQTFNLSGVEYPNTSKVFMDGITKLRSVGTFNSQLEKMIHPEVGKHIPLNLAIDLLKKMLDVRMDRYSASQCLNHPFFTTDPVSVEMIKKTREEFEVKSDGSILKNQNDIIVSSDPCRKLMFQYAISIEADRRQKVHKWFTYQIWFSTIDLFDRWLVWRLEKDEETPNEQEIFIVYHTCLYIMIKTCSTTQKNVSFRSLNSKLLKYQEEFLQYEKEIVIEAVNCEIFRHTIYDELTSFDQEKEFPILKNLVLGGLPKYNGKKWRKLAEAYVSKLEKERLNQPKIDDQVEGQEA